MTLQGSAAGSPGPKFANLDVARGAAALLVVVGHLRAFLLVDYVGLADTNTFWKVTYFLTSLGHEAVMVFFVLSGFLISSNIAKMTQRGAWSWARYLLKRVSRLWIVLVPALLLTLFWDQLGMHLTNSDLYAGKLADLYHSTPHLQDESRTFLPSTLVYNLLFLQTVLAPTFGTNGPLWSLANEFWYYMIFPLLYVPLTTRSMHVTAKVLSIACAAALCVWLPAELVVYGCIWLLGYAVFLVHENLRITGALKALLLPVGILMCVAALLVSKTSLPLVVSDFFLGIAFSLLLLALLDKRHDQNPILHVLAKLSEFSYTLYLTHFPILAFVACYFLKNQRFVPSLPVMLLFGLLLSLVAAYASGVYLLFEKHTRAIQRYLALKLFSVKAVRLPEPTDHAGTRL